MYAPSGTSMFAPSGTVVGDYGGSNLLAPYMSLKLSPLDTAPSCKEVGILTIEADAMVPIAASRKNKDRYQIP